MPDLAETGAQDLRGGRLGAAAAAAMEDSDLVVVFRKIVRIEPRQRHEQVPPRGVGSPPSSWGCWAAPAFSSAWRRS